MKPYLKVPVNALFVKSWAVFLYITLSVFGLADGVFEMGQVNLTTTIENGGWQFVPLTAGRYNNPVVIAGPLTEANTRSLSVRVRNVSAGGFEIGMQSPCESEQRVAGSIACPPADGSAPDPDWLTETVEYLVIEEGTWTFPDGRKVEAYTHTSSTVRSRNGNQSAGDTISYTHSYVAAPVVLHTINSADVSYGASHPNAGAVKWISTSVWGGNSRANPPTTTNFTLALEGAEVTTSHGFESIAWLAIEAGSGTNAGFAYQTGRTGSKTIDRRDDGCYVMGSFGSIPGVPNAVAQHNSMNGNNGAWVTLCNAGITANNINVHVTEDQVNDTERTGIPEYGAWFAFESGGLGELHSADVSLEKTVDTSPAAITAGSLIDLDASGNLTPGDQVRFDITVTNLGSSAANDITVVDVVTSGYSYITTSIAGGDSRNASDPSVTGLTWSINSLAAGASLSLSYQVDVLEIGTPSAYLNTASLSSLSFDSDASNNADDVIPDIVRISKQVCNETAEADSSCDSGDFATSVDGKPGDTLVYQVRYESFATEVLTFDFSDSIPTNTRLLENVFGSAEVQVNCHASASISTATLDLGAVSSIDIDLTDPSVCDGSIVASESGSLLFKVSID